MVALNLNNIRRSLIAKARAQVLKLLDDSPLSEGQLKVENQVLLFRS